MNGQETSKTEKRVSVVAAGWVSGCPAPVLGPCTSCTEWVFSQQFFLLSCHIVSSLSCFIFVTWNMMKRLIHYYLKCLSVKCLCFKYALLYTFGLRNDYCFTVIILYFGNLICVWMLTREHSLFADVMESAQVLAHCFMIFSVLLNPKI